MAESGKPEATSPQKKDAPTQVPSESCKASGKPPVSTAASSAPSAEPVSPNSVKPVVREPAPAPAKNPWHRNVGEKPTTAAKLKDGTDTSSGGDFIALLLFSFHLHNCCFIENSDFRYCAS